MHGQSLVLNSPGEGLTRIDESSIAHRYANYELLPPSRGLDLHALWLVILRNRALMLTILLLCLAAGALSVWMTKPVYSARASVQIEPQAPRVMGTESLTPDAGRSENDRVLQTQVDLLTSRSTAERVAAKLKLANNPQFLREAGLDEVPAGTLRNAMTTTALQENMTVSSPEDTRIISIQYDSQNPVLAAAAANTFADTFISDSLQRKQDTYAYSLNFLKGQLETTKARLERAERGVVDYARSADLVDAGNAAGGSGSTDERRSITTASLVDVNAAYSQARANRMAAQSRWQQAQSSSAMNLPEVLSNPAVQNLTAQRAALQGVLQQERQRRQDDHPAVIQAQAQISELDRQIGSIAAGVRASIGNQYRVAAGQEGALRGNVSALKSASLAEQGKGVRYNVLKREADTNRNLFNALQQRFHEVSTQAGNLTSAISVIDRATMPSEPSSPRPALNMALAGLAGVALALGAGFTRARTDDKVHGPDDVQRDFQIPLLGVVPLLKGKQTFEEALDDPQSPVTEAHHVISLALDPIARDPAHAVLLLTSSCPNEGKSMTAFKLSENFAASGKNVLVIDGDLRRGSMHRILALPNRRGLGELLARGNEDPLSSAVQFCEARGFSVLTRGRSTANAAELLASMRFGQLLEKAAELYDVVVIDGPPVLGLADAPRLSSMADVTVFVVEANRTSMDHANVALRRLREAGAEQIGVVISKYDPEKDAGSSTYAQSYDYAAFVQDEGFEEPRRAGRNQQAAFLTAEVVG